MGDHLLNFGTFVATALEILANAVLQADSLAYINNLVLLPVHNVNSRLTGKLF